MIKKRKYLEDGSLAPKGYFELLCDSCKGKTEVMRMKIVERRVIYLCQKCRE